MEKITARWEATRISQKATRYALRTAPRDRGDELGSYISWNNSRAEVEAEKIALALEQQAAIQGYAVDLENSWNDLN